MKYPLIALTPARKRGQSNFGASSEWEDSQKSRAVELVTVHETMLLNENGSRMQSVLLCANLAIEVDGMKDDVAETETGQRRGVVGVVRYRIDCWPTRSFGWLTNAQQQGWTCADGKWATYTITRQTCFLAGKTTSLSGIRVSGPARCAHLPGNEFENWLIETRYGKKLFMRTSVIQSPSSEDRKDFNVEQAHERTVRHVITRDVISVSDSSQTRSAHESETFNGGDEILRKRTERSVADHDVSHESIVVNETDMDFRIPRLPHSVVKHPQSTSVRELIQKIENHPDRHVLRQDLRQNQSFNPFNPESKQMIQDVGNIELCELLETEPKTQCRVCLSYWNTGKLYCTCGHFLRIGKRTNQNIIHYTMDLLSVPKYVIKKEMTLMDIEMVRSQETNNITRLTNWRRNAKREISKESMTDSYEIKNSEFEWLKIIETKIFVDDGMLLRNEHHTHHLTAQEYLHLRANGGFIQINKVLIPCHWGIDLTSSKHCLPCNGCNKKQEKNHMCLRTLTSTKQWEAHSSSSTWWNWQSSWWTPYHSESQERDAQNIEWTVRPVACNTWQDSSEKDFQEFVVFCYK